VIVSCLVFYYFICFFYIFMCVRSFVRSKIVRFSDFDSKSLLVLTSNYVMSDVFNVNNSLDVCHI